MVPVRLWVAEGVTVDVSVAEAVEVAVGEGDRVAVAESVAVKVAVEDGEAEGVRGRPSHLFASDRATFFADLGREGALRGANGRPS